MKTSHESLFIFSALLLLVGFSFALKEASPFPQTNQLAQVGGTPRGVPLSHALGVLPASPDGTVFMQNFPSIITTSRTAGAQIFYWYWSPQQVNTPDPSVAALMPLLGHPVAVTISVFQPGSIGNLPASCTDWKTAACQTLIANDAALFAKTYLQTSDYLFVGNEVNSYLINHQSDIPSFQSLVTKVVDAVHVQAPTIRVGVVFYYTQPQEAFLRTLYNGISSKPDLVGYTAYAAPNFHWGNPVDGITELSRVQTHAASISSPYAILETEWGTAASLDSSESEQNDWASQLKSWLNNSSAEFLSIFIALDGDTAGQPCFNAAKNLNGGQTPTQNLIDYLCTLGLRDVNNNPKLAWATLWSNPTVSSLVLVTSLEATTPAGHPFTLDIKAQGAQTTLVTKTITPTNDTLSITGISLPATSHDLYLSAIGYLRKKVTTVLNNGLNITIPMLLAGNISSNNDQIINTLDWSAMSSQWGTANTQSDINRDGVINSIDFYYLNKNWMQVGD